MGQVRDQSDLQSHNSSRAGRLDGEHATPGAFVLADAQSLPQYDDGPPWPYGQALSRIWPVKQPVVHWPAS
jgi:hypothetical protein